MRSAWAQRAGRTSVVRAALNAIGIVGIAIGGSMASQRIAFAQAGAAFEVASVPTATAGSNTARASRTPQRIAFKGAQAGDIIAFAYGIPLDRVERRPQWMYDDFYDVAVTTAAPASLPEQKLMLQKLLKERFGLAVHRVSKEGSVYFLVAHGPNVSLAKTEEADSVDIPRFRAERIREAGTFQPGTPVYTAEHISMSDLADWLYSQVRLPVYDKTGITGLFDIEIALPPRAGAERTITAVHDQLGLDLELHRGPADMLMIDHSERP